MPTVSPPTNANSSIPAPRTRARAKTQGNGDEPLDNIFVFGGAPPSRANEQLLPVSQKSSTQKESSGGSNLASSLLRRFSSKRRPARDVSVPTTMGTQTAHHQQNYSQPTNYYLPELSPESPISNSFNPMQQANTPTEHKVVRKPVANSSNSTQAQHLARSSSSRPSQVKAAPVGEPKPEFLMPPQNNSSKRYHPSARAKSLGHVRGDAIARDIIARQREETQNPRVPGLPINPESADIADEFFDQPFDDSRTSSNFSQKERISKQSLGTSRSSQTSNTTEPASMPSIEFPKQVFLKGFFSVQSTSTKSLAYIRSDIIRVLDHLGVEYKEIKGGFACIHRPSIRSEEDPFATGSSSNMPTSRGGSRNHLSPPQSPLPPNSGFDSQAQSQRGHWRKLSFGSGIFGNGRRKLQSESSGNIVDYSDMSTDSMSGTYLSTSVTAPSNAAGNSDMLGNPRSTAVAAARTPLQFEIWIVRVPLLSLHGVQFKKLRGNSWLYKSLASKILAELRL